jgi:hypothetical protein
MAYTKKEIEKVFNNIIQDIEDGKALRTILKYSGMPSSSTFYIWIEEDKAKSKRYAHACEVRADNIFEDILSIADESENDVKRDKDGKEITNGEVIQRSRLRVDARKWYLSKLSPKKYGDKIDVNSNNVNHNINQDLTAEEVKKISDNLEDNY